MQFYMAPMEGLTGYILRNAYHKYFGDIDKYFTPFISGAGLSHRELNDVLPEHNEGLNVVPQILTNKAEDFLGIAKLLKDFGYETVNLNLGCPSGTVVSKGRGAGFLAHTEELDNFIEEIFARSPLKISIKTRLGLESAEEWERLQGIYNKYPLEELIIHPRVQKDLYRNSVNLDVFEKALAQSKAPVCYNGEIHSTEDYVRFKERFPQVDTVMLGRGILKNPGLVGEIKALETSMASDRVTMAECVTAKEQVTTSDKVRDILEIYPVLDEVLHKNAAENVRIIKAFHDDILNGYCEIMSGDRNTLFKMKEIWSYLGEFFEDSKKSLKKIKKAGSVAEYRAAVRELLQ